MTAKLSRLRAALVAQGPGSSDFDLNPDVQLPPGRKLREAAVLVPVIDTGLALEVLLTKRSSALKHHPGQVAFPGGKRDEEDIDLAATARREAWEEVRVPPETVDIIGTLPVSYTHLTLPTILLV